MATNDELAERLRAIASSDRIPIGYIRAATDSLIGVGEEIMTILSPTSSHYSPVMGAMGEAQGQLDNALAALAQFERTLHDAADAHQAG